MFAFSGYCPGRFRFASVRYWSAPTATVISCRAASSAWVAPGDTDAPGPVAAGAEQAVRRISPTATSERVEPSAAIAFLPRSGRTGTGNVLLPGLARVNRTAAER